MEVKNLLLPTRKKDPIYRLLESILFSYVLLIIIEAARWLSCKYISKTQFTSFNVTKLENWLIIILIGIFFGFIMAIVVRSRITHVLLSYLGISITHYPSAWNEVLDGESVKYNNHRDNRDKGSVFIRVYLDEEQIIYDGFVKAFTSDPNVLERDIYLMGFRSFSYNGELLEDYYGNWSVGVLISANRISRLENLSGIVLESTS